jgi:hypothetical protein
VSLQHAGDFDRAVTVSIGLNDARHFNVRSDHGTDIAEIAGDLFPRNENI